MPVKEKEKDRKLHFDVAQSYNVEFDQAFLLRLSTVTALLVPYLPSTIGTTDKLLYSSSPI
jgi:hypothetical protein